jgi:hypothetical protein
MSIFGQNVHAVPSAFGNGTNLQNGLMEPQEYAKEMICELEAARPKYLISIAMVYLWLRIRFR